MTHPLLPRPVPNSLSSNVKGAIITGPHMSGKSTFLRTAGVNLLLATMICTTRDKRFCARPMHRELLSHANENRPAFIVIDEMLAGTNSEERIAASIRILHHMKELYDYGYHS
jgi:DNA mismatch repair ATPase MutS